MKPIAACESITSILGIASLIKVDAIGSSMSFFVLGSMAFFLIKKEVCQLPFLLVIDQLILNG